MIASNKPQMKRKVTPTKQEPTNKSIKIGTEAAETSSKLTSMKKLELVRYCEQLLNENKSLLQQKNQFIEAETQYKLTLNNLEKTVEELKEKCSNTPVYLCSDCDYVAECVHDFNDHTHSIDDGEDQENSNFNCKFCDESFETLSEVMEHKKLIHTSNVQHCKNYLENICLYGNSCWFLHSERLKNSEPDIKCNFCERKFQTVSSLREHMKEMHIQMVSQCRNEMTCKFGQHKCWFLHTSDIEKAYHRAKRSDIIKTM